MGDKAGGVGAGTRFGGRCVLIVEDDYFLADDLAKGLARHDLRILGPVPSRAEALALVRVGNVDGALLDINLDGDMVYEVADALIAHAVPFVFVTGYDPGVIPVRFAAVPICRKPIDSDAALAALIRVSSA